MKNKVFPYLCLILLSLPTLGLAQKEEKAAKINVRLETEGEIKVGDKVRLLVEVEPLDEWHIYSSVPSEEGVYEPAVIGFEITSEGFDTEGEMSEEGFLIEKMDDIMGGMMRYYKRPVVYMVELTVTEPEIKVEGYFDYMACNEWKCIALSQTFSLEAKATAP